MTDLPMIIDSFAGGGGASTGIEMALGRSPDVAINHSADALALHAANHPDTLHLDSNIWDVTPREVTGGRKIGLLWASPDCKHFSKAKGGAPRDRNIRDLAWTVIRWAELPKAEKPDVICMENVEEFQTWGPVDNDGKPIREFEGMIFLDWITRLRRAGYKVQHRELRACDYGAPTIRKRWFLVARSDGRPIIWPKPTHGDPASPAVRKGKLKPWRTAAECIDWSLPCPSIFDSADQIMARHGLRAIRPLADNTLARIARGMKRYVLDAERPFLVQVGYGEAPGQQPRALDLDAPLGTVVAGGIKHALVAPNLVSVAHGDSGGRREYPVTDPYGVVLAGGISHAVVAPSLLSLKGTARRAGPVHAPHPTVLAGGGHSALITPVLTYAQHGGAVRDPGSPMHTIAASHKDQNAVIIGSIVGCGGRAGQSRPRGLAEPLATATAKADACLATAFLAQHNSNRKGPANPGRAALDPMATLTASGSQQTPVAAFFAKYYGTAIGARMDEPAHTVTVNDRFGHVQADLRAPPFGPEHAARARAVADFLRAHGAWSGGDVVTLVIDGQEFAVVDIGMRMLTPRELFNAQGFPPDYQIEGIWREVAGDWSWHPFTNKTQVSCCGNSVCPELAAAIVGSNCGHLAAERQAA